MRAAQTILFAIAAAVFVGCEAQPVEIELDVYGNGAGFEGLYEVDGDGEDVSFASGESTSDVHTFSATLEVTESLSVDVFPEATAEGEDDTSMTSITCRITSGDGEVLFEDTYSINSTAMKTFTYQIQ